VEVLLPELDVAAFFVLIRERERADFSSVYLSNAQGLRSDENIQQLIPW
jgi:hypothetical protein